MSSGNDYPERLPAQPTTDQALDALKYDADGLVTVVAQDAGGGEVLMVAHANREALAKSLETGRMHYYSRSRKKLWMKGEDSGHTQELVALISDCDGDALVAKVRQVKGACHRGTRSCFAFEIRREGGVAFIGKKVFDPKDAYRKGR